MARTFDRLHTPLALLALAGSALLGYAPASPQAPLGTPWVAVSPRLGALDEIERSPQNPQLVIAARGARLVRSVDGGQTFADVPHGLAQPISDVEIGSDGRIFVGTGSSLLVSFDGGITFVAHGVPVPSGATIATLAVDPQDSSRVWAGLRGVPRALRSLDGGASWDDVTPPVNFFADCVALDVDPTDSNRVVAVNQNYYAHVTHDGGTTWNVSGFVAAGDSARDVAFVGANIVLVTSARAVLSTDLGMSWSLLPVPSGVSGTYFFVGGTDIEVDRSAPGRVLISGEHQGVFASLDAGATWGVWPATAALPVASMALDAQGTLLMASPSLGLVEVGSGVPPRIMATASLAALGLARAARPVELTSNPVAPQQLALIASDSSSFSVARILLVSGDAGASWTAELGLGGRPVSARFAPDGRLFVGTRVGIGTLTASHALLRRDPQGWTPIGPTVSTGETMEVSAVAASARQPALVFAASLVYDPLASGAQHTLRVHRSQDGGASWTTVYGRVADAFVGPTQLVVTEGSMRAVHLLDTALDFALSGFDTSIVQSTRDDGATWTGHALGQHQVSIARSIAQAPRNPGRIVVTDVRESFAQVPLEHSDDGGVTWIATGPPLAGAQVNVGSLAMPDVLFRATGNVVQRVEYAGEVAYDLDMVPGSLGALHGVHVAGPPERVYALASDDLYAKDLPALVGLGICGPAVSGSSGAASGLLAIGTRSVAANTLTLRARRVPFNTVGLFLVSDQLGFTPGAGGSLGNLCLAGAIGRFGPLPAQSGTTGQLERVVDLNALPRPAGTVVVQAGQTWAFQAWFRDLQGGAATSNFSDALSVTFTP